MQGSYEDWGRVVVVAMVKILQTYKLSLWLLNFTGKHELIHLPWQ